MRRSAAVLLALAIALPAMAKATDVDSDYEAFERRVDAARERYSGNHLPERVPDEDRRLQGRLRDALPAAVRTRILAFAETNRLTVIPSFVVSTEGRTNDVWVGVSMSVFPDGPDRAFGRDVVFRLHSRTFWVFPDYGDDFETYTLKHGAFFYKGAWRWDTMFELADWAAIPKANITWCGIDLWEIEHEDFRDGLLRRIPFEEAFEPLSFPPPPEHPGSPPTDEAFALAVQAITNRLAAVDMDVLAEEARQISDHVPYRRIPRPQDPWSDPSLFSDLPIPESWLVPFRDALGPVCDELLFELTPVRRVVKSGTERAWPALKAQARIGEALCSIRFFPFDCKPKRIGTIESIPGTDGGAASPSLWASPFLLITPAADESRYVFW